MEDFRHGFDLRTRPMEGNHVVDYKQSRLARFEAAKQIFNELSQEHLDAYQSSRNRAKCPCDPNELEQRQKEIEILKLRLDSHRNGLGTAQAKAEEERIEEQKRRAELALLAEQQRIQEEERYKIALEEEKRQKNEVKKLVLKRHSRMNRAKQVAIGRENKALQNYMKTVAEQKKRDEEEKQKQREDMIIKMPPMSAFPKSVNLPEIGELPVNLEAIEYKKMLEQAHVEEKELKAKRKADNIERTKRAAFRMKCQRVRRDLQDDMNNIHQYEVDEQLEYENLKRPASELPMVATYLVDEKYKKRSECISMFLSAPEAPKPRRTAPQPVPIHCTSPNVSDDEC